ncbi:MAG: DsbC family protein [Proteobacteria bacterium]|nr:DsbC family protein [Burkholderiales bacterium]
MRILVWCLVAGVLLGASSTQSFAQVERDLQRIVSQRMQVQIDEVRALPYGGLYEMLVNGQTIAYTDAKGQVIIVGTMFDTATKQNLTERRQRELLSVDWKSLPLDRAIVYSKGNGSRRMAVFSDPDCPFCRKLESEIAGLNDITVYTFLYPIAELHPDAPRKANAVWCAKDPGRAWLDLMLLDRQPPPPEGGQACAAPLKEVAELARKFRITGTPGLIFESGVMVPGLINRVQIEQNLK